jgi:hypothetical protein
VERSNLKQLNEVQGKEQYQFVQNRFEALENLDYDTDIDRAWDTLVENTKISAKGKSSWFNEGCSQTQN